MIYLCNPMNLPYRYQFFKVQPDDGDLCEIHREAADPSMVLFKGKYYLFLSVTGGFFRSEDLAFWRYFPLPDTLPLSDYAPDVRVIGEYLYFSASSHDKTAASTGRRIRKQENLKNSKGLSRSGTRICSAMMTGESISTGAVQIWSRSMAWSWI